MPADPNGGFGDDGGDACDDDGDGGARDGAGAGAGARLAPRTIELLEYDAAPSGGSRGHAALGWHTDSGSLLTLLALLIVLPMPCIFGPADTVFGLSFEPLGRIPVAFIAVCHKVRGAGPHPCLGRYGARGTLFYPGSPNCLD